MKETMKEAFDHIVADDALKTKTHAYIEARYHRKKQLWPKKIAIATTLCLVLLAVFGYQLYFTPVYALSLDVDASIELQVNRFDKIIGVQDFTTQAENDILQDIQLYHKDCNEAVEEILHHFQGDKDIFITVTGNDTLKKEEVYQQLNANRETYANVHCQMGNDEKVEEAHAAGMSFGKYQAFLELQEVDPTIQIEEVKDLTPKQIRDRIQQIEGYEDKGNGKGHGHGQKASCQ